MNVEKVEVAGTVQQVTVNALQHEGDVFFDAIEEDLDAIKVVRDHEAPPSHDGSCKNMEDVDLHAEDQEPTGIT